MDVIKLATMIFLLENAILMLFLIVQNKFNQTLWLQCFSSTINLMFINQKHQKWWISKIKHFSYLALNSMSRINMFLEFTSQNYKYRQINQFYQYWFQSTLLITYTVGFIQTKIYHFSIISVILNTDMWLYS